MELLVRILQVISGCAWLVPFVLLTPAVARIWTAPRNGPGRPDPLDVLMSPLAFVAALQISFVVRWFIFPGAIQRMGQAELIVWSGLYMLSSVAAVAAVLAWRITRHL